MYPQHKGETKDEKKKQKRKNMMYLVKEWEKKTSERRWEKLERCGQIKMWTKKKKMT